MNLVESKGWMQLLLGTMNRLGRCRMLLKLFRRLHFLSWDWLFSCFITSQCLLIFSALLNLEFCFTAVLQQIVLSVFLRSSQPSNQKLLAVDVEPEVMSLPVITPNSWEVTSFFWIPQPTFAMPLSPFIYLLQLAGWLFLNATSGTHLYLLWQRNKWQWPYRSQVVCSSFNNYSWFFCLKTHNVDKYGCFL